MCRPALHLIAAGPLAAQVDDCRAEVRRRVRRDPTGPVHPQEGLLDHVFGDRIGTRQEAGEPEESKPVALVDRLKPRVGGYLVLTDRRLLGTHTQYDPRLRPQVPELTPVAGILRLSTTIFLWP